MSITDQSPRRAPRILFVCLGNICRSPAAEAVTARVAAAAGLTLALDSAGTGDWHCGEPPYPPMQQAARARGVDLSALRARQVKPADFGQFDEIIVMDADNLRAVEALRPAGSAVPVRLFLDDAPGRAGEPVPDPYFTRDFDGALDLIEAAAAGLVARLKRQA